MPTVFPTALQVLHLVYTPDGDTDSRGNPTGALGLPIPRKVIGFYRPGAPNDPISMDYMARTISEIVMFVYDPTDYNKLDEVQVNDGAQTLVYRVQGQPMSWATGYPWRAYAGLLGGEVHLKRVE
jgi:hypothetical protein